MDGTFPQFYITGVTATKQYYWFSIGHDICKVIGSSIQIKE